MEDTIYHRRLTNMMFIACQKVLQALIPSLIFDLYPNKSLDEYVQLKREKILKTKIGQINYRTLFPIRNRHTDIKTWDLQLLFFIAECIVSSDSKIKECINTLRCIRNELCHGHNTFVSKEQYTEKLKRIEEIIDELLQIIGDDKITQDIKTQKQNIINGELDLRDCLENLKDWLESDKDLLSERCTFSEEQMHILDYLKSLFMDDQESIPDTKLVIRFENCNKEQEDTMCRNIVDCINEKAKHDQELRPQPGAADMADLSKIIDETFRELLSDGAVVVKAELGCVILTVRCRSITNFERVWFQCVNGGLTQTFNTLQSYLRKTYNNEVSLDVMLPEIEFLRVIEQMVENLSTKSLPVSYENYLHPVKVPWNTVDGSQFGVIQKDLTQPEVILVVFRPRTGQELVNIIRYVSSGKLNEILSQMNQTYEHYLKEKYISINTMLCELDTRDLIHVGCAAGSVKLPITAASNKEKYAVLCINNALNTLLQKTDKNSNLFKLIASVVSDYIKSLSRKILEVTACYELKDKSKVKLLVKVERDIDTDVENNLENLTFELRKENDVNNESKVALFRNGNCTDKLTKNEDDKLKRCIARESKELLKKHSNITMISPNNVKSIGFGSEIHTMERLACIVLFVPVKGLIPISEEPFPPMIENYPTDVMEGTFKLFGQRPGDYHETLKTGCQITCRQTDRIGTIGPFVQLQQSKVGFITSAHIVYDPWQFDHLPLSEGKADVTDFKIYIYQPDHMDDRNLIGQVKQMFVKDGDENGRSSMEIAVVELVTRETEFGIFPECSFHSRGENDFCNSNEVYTGEAFSNSDEVLLESEVVMFGSQSGASTGTLHTLSSTVPFVGQIHLFNQILVEGKSVKNKFAEEGDSGALVFTRKCNGSLKIIGLLVGGMSGSFYIVTPIWEIINSIGYTLLKDIPDVKVQGNIASEITSLRKTVEEVKSNLEKTNANIDALNNQLQEVLGAFQNIKRNN